MTQLDLHYTDPRLVDQYDIENPHGPDFDFFLALADALHALRIVDLGCGTGLLTRQLAIAGREVTGVDPAAAMLAYARRQPGAERVTWIDGDSHALGTPAADLVLMTSNVAQVFLDDDAWAATLRHIYAALRPGGHLAFESRNPADRAWERWNPQTTAALLETPHGPRRNVAGGGGGGKRPCPLPGSQYLQNYGRRCGCRQHAALSQPRRNQRLFAGGRVHCAAGVRQLGETAV
jgi:SAM-dependent methyltransferase